LHRYGKKLEESVENIKTSNTRIGKLDSLLIAGREPILIFVVVTVIYIQTALLGSALGPILISLLFFYRALNSLMTMQVKWNKFLAVSGSLENMTSFQKELRKHKEKTGKTEINERIKNIELSNISFYYNETLILKDISLEVKQNETVAFVGESGSGKTTLINVISGLLSPDSGNYCINGKNNNNLNIESLRNKIGYITQDPVIFNDTIFNNISFWSEKNSKNLKKFWKAVEQAAILDFINELPEKENTILGNNGVNLSGGQRQRISIARELFKDIEILILDEATSALDSETEKEIQANIDLLKGQYTILIIAHRISTIKNADRIVVMKNGRLSSIGTFSDLREESTYFKKLVELQEL
jgi:subfamily B ATP-binding cassette protein MsbA